MPRSPQKKSGWPQNRRNNRISSIRKTVFLKKALVLLRVLFYSVVYQVYPIQKSSGLKVHPPSKFKKESTRLIYWKKKKGLDLLSYAQAMGLAPGIPCWKKPNPSTPIASMAVLLFSCTRRRPFGIHDEEKFSRKEDILEPIFYYDQPVAYKS